MTTPDYAGIRARLAAATEALSPEAAQVVSVPIPLREASALLAERDDLLAENQRLRDTIQAVDELLAGGVDHQHEGRCVSLGGACVKDEDDIEGLRSGIASLLDEACAALGVSGE